MANQIAANLPTADAPEINLAHHIVQFWTPTMIERLHNDVNKAELSPVVLKAIEILLVRN
jgi:formate dehydrogenase major subunit